MNLPNRLTVFRAVMIVPFVAILLLPRIPHNYLWALLIFAVASITDWLDGSIARKRGLVTDFGKFLDPLADKMLVTSALICFIPLGLCHSVAVVIVIAREFVVTSLRLVAAGSGKVIAANWWGKVKTASTMVAIVAILLAKEIAFLGLWPFAFSVEFVSNIAMWLVAGITVVSGATYLVDNRGCIDTVR